MGEIEEATGELLKLWEGLGPLLHQFMRKSGIGPTCKRGCTHCCSMMATVHLLEGLLLADNALKLPDWKRVAMSAREASIAGQGIYDSREYFKLDITCPLLNQSSNDCMLYEFRPGPCRWYYVSSPVELCDPKLNTTKKVAMLDNRQFRRATLGLCVQATNSSLTTPLPLMLVWCMRKRAETEEAKKFMEKAVKGLDLPENWFKKAMAREEAKHEGAEGNRGTAA